MPDPGGSANTWGNTLNGTTSAVDLALWNITHTNATFTGNVTVNGTLTTNGFT